MPKRKRGKQYTTKQRGHAKALYETGNYSALDLAEKLRISQRSIEGWIAKYGWQKGRLAPRIEMAQAERTVQMYADAGLPRPERVKRQVDLVNLLGVLTQAVSDAAQKFAEEPGAATMAAQQTAERNLVQVARIVQAALTDIKKECGEYAPEKREEVPHRPKPPGDLSKLSDAELKQFIALTDKACAD
jgi:hypothetical protein